MRKLIESTLISLDGVIESPDRWATFDEESVTYAIAALEQFDGFVMGRVGYERLRALWEPIQGSPYVDAINAMPKYVASGTLTEVGWNATLLRSDVVAEVARLKSEPGRDLVKYGTSRIDGTLLRAGLIDELRLWTVPVVAGTGQRLFEDVDVSGITLTLSDLHRFANGSVMATYLPS